MTTFRDGTRAVSAHLSAAVVDQANFSATCFEHFEAFSLGLPSTFHSALMEAAARNLPRKWVVFGNSRT